MKKCPYCAEDIQDAAIVCRYCGRDLVAKSEMPIPKEVSQPPSPAAILPPPPSPQFSALPKKRKTSCWSIGCLVLLLTFLILAMIGTCADQSPPNRATGKPKQTVLFTQQQDVPIHSEPSPDSEILGHLELAERVVSIREQGEWHQLGGTKAQWVKKSLLGRERPLTPEELEQKTSDMLAELRTIPASEARRNRDLYKQLVEMHPEEPGYHEKLEHYSKKVQEQRELERQEQARQEEERMARLVRFGSPPEPSTWDGTYREIRDYLERVANDPDSIKIDACTKVYHTADGWLVGCDYRGRNAFGGIIRQSNWFTIVDGRVVEMHDFSVYSP